METKLTLQELIIQTEKQLKHLQYAESTIAAYWCYWRKLLNYAEETGTKCFTVEFGEQFLLEKYGIDVLKDKNLNKLHIWTVKAAKRSVYVLADFQNLGVVTRKHSYDKLDLPDYFSKTAEAFYSFCRKRYNSEETVRFKKFTVNSFLWHIEQKGVKDISTINQEHISSYMLTTVSWSQRTVASTIGNLRQFLAFLYQEKYIDTNLSDTIPQPRHARNGKLPNVWTNEQVEKLLASIDRADPIGKRNYAILLLITQLGLRESDVQNLTFDNLCWNECCIRLIQYKTKRPLELPLSKEIGEAIIDYLKYGRPPQDKSQYVFVRHLAPYGKCNSYYHIMRKHLWMAGIPFQKNKSHGLHTLRHTLATRLLQQNIPLQTISEILGHTSSESTKAYLQVDMESLRQCALNPEEV